MFWNFHASQVPHVDQGSGVQGEGLKASLLCHFSQHEMAPGSYCLPCWTVPSQEKGSHGSGLRTLCGPDSNQACMNLESTGLPEHVGWVDPETQLGSLLCY